MCRRICILILFFLSNTFCTYYVVFLGLTITLLNRIQTRLARVKLVWINEGKQTREEEANYEVEIPWSRSFNVGRPIVSFSFFLSVLSKHSLFSKFIIISVIFGAAKVTKKRCFASNLPIAFHLFQFIDSSIIHFPWQPNISLLS